MVSSKSVGDPCHWWHPLLMKEATLDDLRTSFAKIDQWLSEGEAIEITKGGKPYAHLTPATVNNGSASRRSAWPAPADRLKELRGYCGGSVLSEKDAEEIFNSLRGERIL